MDFITNLIEQIITIVKSSPTPELYYLASAAALIFIFYLIHKAMKVMIFFLIIGTLLFGLGITQSKDISTVIAFLKTSIAEMFSGATDIGEEVQKGVSKITDAPQEEVK